MTPEMMMLRLQSKSIKINHKVGAFLTAPTAALYSWQRMGQSKCTFDQSTLERVHHGGPRLLEGRSPGTTGTWTPTPASYSNLPAGFPFFPSFFFFLRLSPRQCHVGVPNGIRCVRLRQAAEPCHVFNNNPEYTATANTQVVCG